MVQLGDRFRVTRTLDPKDVTTIPYAPSHTGGTRGRLPFGTVIVAFDQQPEATAFMAYPEAYDDLETELVPPEVRAAAVGPASA